MSDAATAAGLDIEVPVPGDWLDLLEGSEDEARERFTELVTDGNPRASAEQRDAVVGGMLDWRRFLLDQGAAMHGVVHAPHPDGGHATWQVLGAVMPMPTAGEVDLAELVSRVLGSRIDPDASVVETFETDLGTGVGLIAQPEIQPTADLPPELSALGVMPAGPVRVGLAVAMAFPHTGGFGFLVMGMSVDPNQVLEVAAITAVIAGRARRPKDGFDDGADAASGGDTA